MDDAVSKGRGMVAVFMNEEDLCKSVHPLTIRSWVHFSDAESAQVDWEAISPTVAAQELSFQHVDISISGL